MRPEIAAKWIANSPLAMVDQYITNLKEYHAFMMDVGLQDGLAASNKEMDASLTQVGVPHKFETYEGNHTNHVKDRFESQRPAVLLRESEIHGSARTQTPADSTKIFSGDFYSRMSEKTGSTRRRLLQQAALAVAARHCAARKLTPKPLHAECTVER